MKEDDNILNQLKRSKNPTVPENYFNDFYSQLMERIDLESGVLSQLKKREKPSLPADYFEKFAGSIENNPKQFELGDLNKSKNPDVKEGYFESFPTSIRTIIENDQKPKTKIISLKWATTIVSVAAAFLIFFTIMDVSNTANTETNVLANQLSEEEKTDMYLSYLSEDELIEFIIEEDIIVEENELELEDYYDYSEEDIENLYLEY